MQMPIRILSSLWLCISLSVFAQQNPEIPQICNEVSGTVALLDCLKSQQDVLRRVLEYEELAAKISEIQTQSSGAPPQPTDVSSDDRDDADTAINRINWFDQNLEVYAIVGSPGKLTAYARLDGREFRLKTGDSIRLARVTEVHSRGINLWVSGHEVSVGLSGRTPIEQTTLD